MSLHMRSSFEQDRPLWNFSFWRRNKTHPTSTPTPKPEAQASAGMLFGGRRIFEAQMRCGGLGYGARSQLPVWSLGPVQSRSSLNRMDEPVLWAERLSIRTYFSKERQLRANASRTNLLPVTFPGPSRGIWEKHANPPRSGIYSD